MMARIYKHTENATLELTSAILRDLRMREDGPAWRMLNDGVRIYTRDSQNPSLNLNGGDYDEWTDYYIDTDGNISRQEDWSAEFDYQHDDIDTYGPSTVEGLQEMVRKFGEQMIEQDRAQNTAA